MESQLKSLAERIADSEAESKQCADRLRKNIVEAGGPDPGEEANPVQPNGYDFDDAAEIINAVGPVESLEMATFTAAYVICRARMRGVLQGLLR